MFKIGFNSYVSYIVLWTYKQEKKMKRRRIEFDFWSHFRPEFYNYHFMDTQEDKPRSKNVINNGAVSERE